MDQNTNTSIICPKCNSTNINIQVVNEAHLKTAHHGILWWIFIGWWWIIIKWIIFTVPALIFKIFGIGKKKKIVNKTKKIAVCQSCGNSWNI